MKQALVVIVAVFLIASCRKDMQGASHADCLRKTNDLQLVRKMIAGSYTWAYTYRYYFINSDTISPQTENRTEKYLFDRRGKVSYQVNNQTQWTKNYDVDYEFKVTLYQRDSATVVIIKDPQTGQRYTSFRAYLCDDSAYFYNPMSSFLNIHFFKRN